MQKELVKLNNELAVSSKRVHSVSEELWDYAHLQFKDADIIKKIDKNPLLDLNDEDIQHPDQHLLSIMMNPDYFGWTCSKIFNTATNETGLELLPMQCAILKELWNHPFPILLASRGFGKCTKWDTWVICENGFRRIGELIGMDSEPMSKVYNLPKVLGENGFQSVEYGWNNGLSDTIKLTTRHGYEIENTLNHPVRVVRNNTISWVEQSDVNVNDYIIIDRSDEWFPNTTDIDENIAYLHGLDLSFSGEQDFPSWILSAPKSSMSAFIRGLMDADGTVDKNNLCVSFSSKSESFVKTLQFFLTKFGIISGIRKKISKRYNYHLNFYGNNIKIFLDRIGFGLKRKQDILNEIISEKFNIKKDIIPSSLIFNKIISLKGKLPIEKTRSIPNESYLSKCDLTYRKLYQYLEIFKNFDLQDEPEYIYLKDLYDKNYYYDIVTNLELTQSQTFDVHIPDDHSFITNGFISHNSFLLGLYAILRALFIQGRKIVITGAGFRQSKIIFTYAEALWYNSPILRDMVGARYDKNQGPHHNTDVWEMIIGDSIIKALPIGSGDKIRGTRAHDILSDEFSSIAPHIFEEVIAGFGVVNIDPIDQVKFHQRMEYIKRSGDLSEQQKSSLTSENSGIMPNQLVMSGTASFAFNHFYHYWKKSRDIILSQGDPQKLSSKGLDPNIDHKKYCIVRIPIDLLPKGFMDEAMVERSRNTMSTSIYENEFGACFALDSSGFFKRSVIESATPSSRNPITLSTGTIIESFSTMLKGDINKKYIMAVDPASVKDNFAIVILEIYPDHARVVYCWTINQQIHTELQKSSEVKERDFYAYCLRKIRDLMKAFNTIHIAMDSQGGGRTIYELLHNEKYLLPGEQLIWEVDNNNLLWDGKERNTDSESGLHILELVNFRNTQYTSDANHGMKHDLEQRSLVFPYIDAVDIILAGKDDLLENRSFDTLEDVLMEVEELKNELTMIIHDPTNTGIERWGAPTAKTASSNNHSTVGQIHDDRYSALVMANSAARRLRAIPHQEFEYIGGGFANRINSKSKSKNSQLYIGPSWYADMAKNTSSYWGIANQD